MPSAFRPPPFLVEIFNTENATELGTGLLINDHQVLTCRHVVEDHPPGSLQRSEYLLESCAIRVHVDSGDGSTPVPVCALTQDDEPNLERKLDLVVLTLDKHIRDVEPVGFLFNLGERQWNALRPAVRRGSVCGPRVLPLSSVELTPDYEKNNNSVWYVQLSGFGAGGGYSGGAALCRIAQHWVCFGVPFLGGDRAGFTKLLGSDCVVSFLDALGIPHSKHDANLAAQVVWATRVTFDPYGRAADFHIGPVSHRMRWVPAGSFRMGYGIPGEVAHEVTISDGFWIGETTCTQELWHAVMESNPSSFRDPQRPVEGTSWNDTAVFLDRLESLSPGLGLRLPTEAEWEYACGAGSDAPFHFGAHADPESANLHHLGDPNGYLGRTLRVRSLLPNRLGLFEMHGNVWEWCSDWYAPYGGSATTDPQGPAQGSDRILRGGSWSFDAPSARSAARHAEAPSTRRADIGFRLARSAYESRIKRISPDRVESTQRGY